MSRARCATWPCNTCLCNKPFSPWGGFMKAYYKKHEEKCIYEDTPVIDKEEVKYFPTGSSYKGAVNTLGMNGYGEYTFPNGVVYRGNFHNGCFHGFGELVFNEGPEAGSVIQGQWVDGVLTEKKILFGGKLEYDTDDWKYCFPDRRYAVEFERGLSPNGEAFITPEQPPRTIPPGSYDTGDGFYNPQTKVVYNYNNTMEVTRGLSVQEQKWIMDNCRKEPLGAVGPRQDLYEKWVEPALKPSSIPEPLVNFHEVKSTCSAALSQDSVPFTVRAFNQEITKIYTYTFTSYKIEKPINYESHSYTRDSVPMHQIILNMFKAHS